MELLIVKPRKMQVEHLPSDLELEIKSTSNNPGRIRRILSILHNALHSNIINVLYV